MVRIISTNTRKEHFMDKKDSGQLMEKIFSNLYNLMIPSSLDENEPSTKLLSIMLPGITLGNDMDPATEKGRQTICEIVDRIPAVAKNYVDTGRKVSQEYQKILGAVTPEDDPINETLREQYQKAKEFLFQNEQYTPKYQKYLDLQSTYDKAHNAYLTECNRANPDANELQKLEATAKIALQNWIVAGKAEIEQALAIMTRFRAFTPATIFSNAIFDYQMAQTASGMITKFIPENWGIKPEELAWETVTVHEKETEDHMHKDISSVSSSFKAGFSAGLWGGSASGQYKSDLEKVRNESKIEEFGMQFKVARVDIIRDWFNGGLLSYPNVYVEGIQKRGICSGSLSDCEGCSFSLLPTALILAKEINVYNNFSQEEKDYVNKVSEWSAHADVHYGPFSLGNDTSCKDVSEDEKKAGFTANGKIEIGEKPQIIGVISTVLSPAFPQMEGPTRLKTINNLKAQESDKTEQMVTQILNSYRGY